MDSPAHTITHITDQWPSGLCGPEKVAEQLGLTVARVVELSESGYMPHYRVDGGSPLFKIGEVKTWAASNILHRIEGRSIPDALRIVCPPGPIIDRPPECIRHIGELKQLERLIVEPGVYFLCMGTELVYVGQSIAPHARIASHKDKKFDRAYLLPVPESELDEVEGAFIRMLRPPLNGKVCTTKPNAAMQAPARGARPDQDVIDRFQSGV